MSFRTLDLSTQLQLARHGTAYFAQKLGDLSGSALSERSLLEGWSRKHIVAHVAYNAAALCRLLDWAATGHERPMYASPQQRSREIDEAATLSAGAVTNLLEHCVARLDSKWRGLPLSAWNAQVQTAQGRIVPAVETVWMRCREVWVHAVDLDNEAQFSDFPAPVLHSLLDDITASWHRTPGWSPVQIDATTGETAPPTVLLSCPEATVEGAMPAIVRWASGRGGIGLSSPTEDVPAPPRWL